MARRETIELPAAWDGGQLYVQQRVTQVYPGTNVPRQITVTITVDPSEEF